MKKTIIILLLLSIGILKAQERKDVSLTIYNDNLGVVKEVRGIDIQNEVDEVLIRDVPSELITASVKIDLDGFVLEQNYRYDLANMSSLLKHFIDKDIKLVGKETIEGKLVSATSNSIIIQRADGGLTILPDLKDYNISLDYMPENLLTKPTLVWKVEADRGKQDAKITYQTKGMEWKAEYVATLNEDDTEIDLNSWVNISNNSGGSFENAELKLIAGDINRAGPKKPFMDYMQIADSKAESRGSQPQFEEKEFFEYHIYELGRRSDILNNEDKQISLFESANIDVTKKYIYNSRGANSEGVNPAVSIEFKNSEDNNLGMPIPKGIVRIYKDDGETVELVGEDNVDHTPKNEDIKLKIGDAFDVVIDEKVESSTKIADKVREFEYVVNVKNRKSSAVTVEINRVLGRDWKILESNIDYKKESANKISFQVPVGADEEKELKYKVRFTY